MRQTTAQAPNSWVHKQYMAERDLEIEHAIDDRYHEIEPHYHEFYELFFFLGGHVDYVVDDQIFEMQRGDLLVIPPSVLHNPIFRDFDVPYERYVLWVSVPCMDRLTALDPELDAFHATAAPLYLLRTTEAAWSSLGGSFMTIQHAAAQRPHCWRSSCLAALLRVLAEYSRAQRVGLGQPGGTRETLLQRVLHYVSDNLTGDLSLDAVSAVFYTNKFTLSHLFQQEMRVSYYQYVIQMRLLAAKKLLLDGVPATRVWEASGFGDYAGFYRAFRKWYGVSPSQFRKLHAALIAPSQQ